MDIQKIGSIDNAKIEHDQKIEKLQESNDIRHIDQYEEDSKNAKQDRLIETQEKEENIKLNTMRYGFNSNTGDLVIKIINADGTVGQYPTDSMMKLKALLKEDFIKHNES